MRQIAIILLIVLFIGKSYSQFLLNGDFELNFVDSCMYNLPDSSFNLLMPHVVSFGEDGGEIDILNGDCTDFIDTTIIYGNAQSGIWYIALATAPVNFSDVALIETSTPLISGNSYSLSYFVKADTNYFSTISDLQIGISENDSTFGYLIHSSTPYPGVWTNQTITFDAPISGNFITVKLDSSVLGWAFIDNFVLSQVSGSINSHFNSEIQLYPNPANNYLIIETLNMTEIEIFNIYGQIIYPRKLMNSDKEYLNISDFNSGTYICKIATDIQIFWRTFYK